MAAFAVVLKLNMWGKWSRWNVCNKHKTMKSKGQHTMTEITFKEALKKLHIEDYGERIFNSNSHGELFHCQDYISIAGQLNEDQCKLFRKWFIETVKIVKEKWQRPESVYQHIYRLFSDAITDANK